MLNTDRAWEGRIDRLIALLLFLCVLCCAASRLNFDCERGDDFAAYLNEAFAIADGTLDEQARRNYRMHPSELPEEAGGGELVYVWGYPLVQAQIYRLVGFDRENYRSILFYKLPLVLSLALSAVLLYSFYRRWLSRATALLLSTWICLTILRDIDSLYSDLFFFFLFCTCLELTERFLEILEEPEDGKRWLPCGFALGVTLLAVYETRLNGWSVCAFAAALQLARLLQRKRAARSIWPALLPWVVFGVGLLVCNYVVFRPATSNISDVSDFNRQRVFAYSVLYEYLLESFLTSVPGLSFTNINNVYTNTIARSVIRLEALLPVCLTLAGCAITTRRSKATLPYLLFFLGNYLVLVLLPYVQGIRYCYLMLPVLMLYFGTGLEASAKALAHCIKGKARPLLSGVCLALSFAVLLNASLYEGKTDLFRVLRGEDVRGEGWDAAYSSQTLDMWRYIREQTPEDCVISFFKPRALYLNTLRESFRPDVNGNESRHADYYLSYDFPGSERASEILEERLDRLTPVFTSGEAVLYRYTDSGQASG